MPPYYKVMEPPAIESETSEESEVSELIDVVTPKNMMTPRNFKNNPAKKQTTMNKISKSLSFNKLNLQFMAPDTLTPHHIVNGHQAPAAQNKMKKVATNIVSQDKISEKLSDCNESET